MKTENPSSTILVISTGLLALHLIFAWEWAVYGSLFFGIIGILSSGLSKKIETLWMLLAKIMEKVVQNLLLTLVFFLFLTPLALLYRLFKKDVLMLKEYNSYFVDVTQESDKKNFERMW